MSFQDTSGRTVLQSAAHLDDDAAQRYSVMQHLIDEIDRSNQRIENINEKYENPIEAPMMAVLQQFDALYDDAWKSEESDGASFQEIPVDQLTTECDDSGCVEAVNSAIAEVSNDFLSGLRGTAEHNQYADSDESHVSSDTDFKRRPGMASYAHYPETAAGLSDNDWNLYGTESDTNASPRFLDGSSFNPPLHSTDMNVITPISGMGRASLSSITDVSVSKDTVISLKADNSLDFFSTPQVTEEQTLNTLKLNKNPPKFSDLNRTMRGLELDAKNIHEKIGCRESNKTMATSTHTTLTGSKGTDVYMAKEENGKEAGSQYMSVIERAKLAGVPEDILEWKLIKPSFRSAYGKEEKSKENGDIKTSKTGYSSDEDHLGKKIQKVLSQTNYLEEQEDLINLKGQSVANLDYNSLQHDLQEIQDSLHRTLGPNTHYNGMSNVSRNPTTERRKTPVSSDSEYEIIPSTTTTPERRSNKMAWDFAADLGYQNPGDLMGEISLDTYTSTSQRPSTEKQSYNSDGDETRTSGSSSKQEDHAAADEALADMGEILQPTVNNVNSTADVDQVLSTFRNQRRQMESRYQQLNNQGLAEKVYRILTSQDPNSQAKGILSDVHAEEKEMKARHALGLQNIDFNISSNSTNFDSSNQSFALPDDVRKRLDLSNISSVDSSRVQDKSSFSVPTAKGFTAFDDMTKFLSSQMAKVSERTFNHSLELRVPQTIQCYPLFKDDNSQREQEKQTEEQLSQAVCAQTSGHRGDDSQRTRSLGATAIEEREVATSENKDAAAEKKGAEYEKVSTKELLSGQATANNGVSSLIGSEAGSGRHGVEKYRPYRPTGSKEVYYTESDTASVADSVTTMESTHIGSDDAKGPSLPASVFGSRKDPPNVLGMYSSQRPLSTVRENNDLPTIEEKSGMDEREVESTLPKGDNRQLEIGNNALEEVKKHDSSGKQESTFKSQYLYKPMEPKESMHHSKPYERRGEEVSINVHTEFADRLLEDTKSRGIGAARRNAKWANRLEEKGEGGSEVPHYERSRNPNPTRVDERTDYDRLGRDSRWAREKDFDHELGQTEDVRPFSLPSDAFVSSTDYARYQEPQECWETEPLSLKIKMTYDDNSNVREKHTSEMEETDVKPRERLKVRTELPKSTSSISRRFADTGNGYSRDYKEQERSFSPQRREATLPRHREFTGFSQGLLRSHSDENLHSPVPNARLSPAFHRALSPELRTAIGTRSPLLSRDLERSLGQPPAYSNQRARERGQELIRSASPPPTFLARERSTSPREYTRMHPIRTRRSPRSPPLRIQEQARPLLELGQHASPQGLVRDQKKRKKNGNSPGNKENQTASKNMQQLPPRKVELTLEGMNSESEGSLEFDTEPISKRAQRLKQALSQNQEQDMQTDINAPWEQFKGMNDSYDSSMNSSKMNAVEALLRNPVQNVLQQYTKDREQYRIERQERAEQDRDRRQKEQQRLRQARQSSSEEELSGSYTDLLMKKEEKRQKRRAAKKKKGKVSGTAKVQHNIQNGMDEENLADNLFSIPEDTSFEQSPIKASPALKLKKSKIHREQNIIDPNMNKLRDRIMNQKKKIDRSMLKELQCVNKLRKLEHLLSIKKNGEISDQTLGFHLEEISSTTLTSDNSNDGGNENRSNLNSTPLSDDSTTVKDSSTEMHHWKAEKEQRMKEMKMEKMREPKIAKKRQEQISKTSQYVSDVGKTKSVDSQLKLLKLIKEGYLTPEQAYELALEKMHRMNVSSQEDVSSNVSHSDDYNSNYSGRLHKQYSPYSREDHFKANGFHHVPKLKQNSPAHSTNYEHDLYQRPMSKTASLQEQIAREQKLRFNRLNSTRRTRPQSKSSSAVERPETYQSDKHEKQRSHHGSPSSHRTHSPARLDMLQSPSRQELRRSPGQRIITRRHHSASPVRGDKGHQFEKHRSPTRAQRTRALGNVLPKGQNTPLSGGVAWHIPMDVHPSLWREPNDKARSQSQDRHERYPCEDDVDVFKRTARSQQEYEDRDPVQKGLYNQEIWHKRSHPPGIPHRQWAEVLSLDALAQKTNHWDVDPILDRVQYILNKPNEESSRDSTPRRSREKWEEKPFNKMTLQEAFLARKQAFVSKCRERQKRLALSSENRHMQECLRLEREAIFAAAERLQPPNLHAHPNSDNLYQPKRRILTKQEMKELTMRKYKKLSEVVEKKESDKRAEECKLNRLRARMFNRKVQRDVLRKAACTMRRR